MCEFESSEVSQAVTQLQIVATKTSEMGAISRFLQIFLLSLYAKIAQSGSEIADSLWVMFEIFPFFGDASRRPGSIDTARYPAQSPLAILT